MRKLEYRRIAARGSYRAEVKVTIRDDIRVVVIEWTSTLSL